MGGRDTGASVRPVGRHPPLHGPADHRRHRQQEGVQVSLHSSDIDGTMH